MKLPFLVAALATAALWSTTAGAASPSFSCSRAISTVEQAVCANPEFAAMDRELARAYRRALRTATPREAARLRAEQLRWLAARDRCGLVPHLGPNFLRCVGRAYDRRIAQLHGWMRMAGGPAY